MKKIPKNFARFLNIVTQPIYVRCQNKLKKIINEFFTRCFDYFIKVQLNLLREIKCQNQKTLHLKIFLTIVLAFQKVITTF